MSMVSVDSTASLPSPDDAGQPPARNDAGQWVKGVSGNPAGRTPGTGSIVVELRRQLQDDHGGHSLAAAIAERLLTMAKDGDIRAIREVLDRIDGPARVVDPEHDQPVHFAPITIGRVARIGP